MNFFRKKLIVYYNDNIIGKEDAKGIFKKIPNNLPKYFFSIPKTMFSAQTKKSIPYSRTIKTCSGFINLYKRSLLITSPFDIYVELDNTKIIDSKFGRINDEFIQIHPGHQLLDYVPNNKKYKFIIKINLPFTIDTNVSMYMSQSIYHFNNFDILPGILPSNYKNYINFFIPVEKEKNEIYIKKGTPLFMFTPLCETEVKLEFKKLKKNMRDYLTFSSLKEFVLKNL